MEEEFAKRFATLCLNTMNPPWANTPPAPAPGGAPEKLGLKVLKHTMLFFSLECLPCLGRLVQGEIEKSVPSDRKLAGAVALPNYYCQAPRAVRMQGSTVMLPCGKMVPLSPLLQLVVDGKPTREWVRDECSAGPNAPAPGGAQGALRCLSLHPMVHAHGTQGKKTRFITLWDKPVMELIVAPEPEEWHVEGLRPVRGILEPTVHGVKTKRTRRWRALYSESESEDVWLMAAPLPDCAR